MKCIFCGCLESKVIDSRSTEDGSVIRRRRECESCKKRFTTYETVEMTTIRVVKSDGNRQDFDPAKIKAGILKACEKRPVPVYKIDEMVENIQKKIYNSLEQEISAKQIGEMVMEELKQVDDVSYVRFASVYRSFRDLSAFMDELKDMINDKKTPKQD